MLRNAKLAAWCFCASCAPAQIITTVAGTEFTFPVQPIPAASAPLGTVTGVAFDTKGSLYVADPDNSLVVRISPAGILTVVAGNGKPGYTGDGGLATAASLNGPYGIALDSAGNLYIADSNNFVVRKVTSGGTITTIAGNGTQGFSGDGGAAIAASFGQPLGVAVDGGGNLYVVDRVNNRIRKVSGGIISTFAGSGAVGANGGNFAGDGGLATAASLNFPTAVAVDSTGSLYIADGRNHRIRKVVSGIINTIAGSGPTGAGAGSFSGDGGPALAATLNGPFGVAVDASGSIYIADTSNGRIRKVTNGTIATIAGTSTVGFSGDGGPALAASLNNPLGVAVDSAGNVFLSDMPNKRVRRVSAQTLTIDTFAGNGLFRFSGDGGSATNSALNLTSGTGVAVDSSGAVYIADSGNYRIRKVAGGIINTFAGTSVDGFPQVSGPVATTPLDFTLGVALDPASALYVANFRSVVKISGGTVTRIPGLDTLSNTNFSAVAVDSAGTVYVTDTTNQQVLQISGGTVTRFAGTGQRGASGNGGPAVNALLRNPRGVAADTAGNVYIADTANSQIRKVSGGLITVFAGVQAADSFFGDGGPAISAGLQQPQGVAVDAAGNLYIADTGNHRIRKVTNGNITTVAGNGVAGFTGDGGPPLSASLDTPVAVALDSAGNLYIGDQNNSRIRAVSTSTVTFQVSPATLSFSGTAGGTPPGARPVSLTSSVPGLLYSTTSTATWLSVGPSSGTIPASLQVTADPSQLAPGSYIGSVTVQAPNATPTTKTFSVSFTVAAANPSKLALSSASLPFALTAGAAPATAQLTISNDGGGSVGFRASAATSSGGNWLAISISSGTVSAAAPVSLTVTADPGKLAAGTYTGSISITSPDTGQQFTVIVTLALKEPLRKILLSQTGLTFTAVAQGGAPLSQSFGILNIGQGSMDWTATATTLSGPSGWLSVSPASGTVATPFKDVSPVSVSVDASRLAAGDYYGQVQVRAASSSNSPQTVSVVLSVLPPGSNPGPELRPTGLIFTGAAGVTPGSQDVRVGNPAPQATDYQSGSIGTGFSFAPSNAVVQPNQPTVVRVYPDFSKLAAGSILRGTITLQFADGTPRNISILTVVAPLAGASNPSPAAKQRDAGGCVPTRLLPVFSQLGSGSNNPAGWPITVATKVVDDCGTPMTDGSVVASFSNGDLPVSLVSLQDGNWTGTWQPRFGGANAVAVSLEAKVAALNLRGTAQSSIGLQGSKTLPVLSGGPVSAATQTEGPLAPGDLILLKGTGLANGQGSSSPGSLGEQLAGASVVIGGKLASLLYADTTQVLGLVPSDLPVNTSQQVLVQRDSNLGLPTPIIIAAAHPAVLTKDGSGQGQAAVYKMSGGSAGPLADATNPVKTGDTILIYCTGLGQTDSSGAAVNTPTVSIGGQSAPVSFAGLAQPASYPPTGVPTLLGGVVSSSLGGLYQIIATVPSGSGNGAASMTISSAGQASQAGVTLAVGSVDNTPAITSINTAYGPADFGQNDFIEIHGRNLAAATAGPSPLATLLGGVSVTVNGKPALLYFVSAAQINALTPLDDTIGPVSVVVTSNGVPSAPFSAKLSSVTPAFLRFDANGHITATHADGSYLGPRELGPAFTPAAPGETIVTYAVGFGLPSTPLVSGSATQSGSLPSLPTCQSGATPVAVAFAGLNGFAGLYQINLTVPATAANGDNPLSCSYGGQTTPAGTLISVQR